MTDRKPTIIMENVDLEKFTEPPELTLHINDGEVTAVTAEEGPFERSLAQTANHVMTALSACLADSTGHPRPHRGTIKCPKCAGTLNYLAKTSARGTIWGRCETDGCLVWMV